MDNQPEQAMMQFQSAMAQMPESLMRWPVLCARL